MSLTFVTKEAYRVAIFHQPSSVGQDTDLSPLYFLYIILTTVQLQPCLLYHYYLVVFN